MSALTFVVVVTALAAVLAVAVRWQLVAERKRAARREFLDQMERMRQSFEQIGEVFGRALLPATRKVTRAFSELARALQEKP